MMRITAVTLAIMALASPAFGQHSRTSESKDVALKNGSTVTVEAGELLVPESRGRSSGRQVTIPYYRLRSTSPAPASPIFLLHGGPGSSWLDQFPEDNMAREVAFYRTIADVVVFDQRGGGRSRPEMTCPDRKGVQPGRPFTPALAADVMRELAIACRDRWLKAGVDLAAYNTVENAADVNDLRLALGYGKITLIGGSYGSHLALQFMRQYPDAVDRVVMFGVEGPDDTWDRPSATLATLARIAAVAEQSSAFAGRIPPGGLLQTLERIVTRLEKVPQLVTVGDGSGRRTVTVTADLVRTLARRGADRRNPANAWPEMILAMDRGDFSVAAQAVNGLQNLQLPDPVHFSMDCASGISSRRLEQVRRDPARALLGNQSLEYEVVCPVWPSADLGEAFRSSVVSNIPTVIIHGTWDTSTPIENARDAAASLSNAQLVEVVGGNHGALYNLYARWQPMYDTMRRFLRGEPVRFPDSVDDMSAIRFASANPQPNQ
jgi:pimeloyl-ACP methyl ester carboxylesterase